MRWAVGEVLRVLAERLGVAVWQHMREPILDSIHNNFVSFDYFNRFLWGEGIGCWSCVSLRQHVHEPILDSILNNFVSPGGGGWGGG